MKVLPGFFLPRTKAMEYITALGTALMSIEDEDIFVEPFFPRAFEDRRQESPDARLKRELLTEFYERRKAVRRLSDRGSDEV